jgi:hypothetical protein
MFKSFKGVCSIFFSLSETYELKRQQHLTELNKKEEDMRQAFVIRVKEKEAHLKDTEKEVVIILHYQCICYLVDNTAGDCHGRGRMVVGFPTTCALSAYHH